MDFELESLIDDTEEVDTLTTEDAVDCNTPTVLGVFNVTEDTLGEDTTLDEVIVAVLETSIDREDTFCEDGTVDVLALTNMADETIPVFVEGVTIEKEMKLLDLTDTGGTRNEQLLDEAGVEDGRELNTNGG